MGCNAAKNMAVVPIDGAHRDLEPGKIGSAIVNNVQKAEHGMSFEITFDDPGGEPPKRLLELHQESDSKGVVTLEKLQEKLEEADIRRQQILQQRVQSANLLKKQKNGDSNEEQSPNHLRVPKSQKSSYPSRKTHLK
ncbi:uncharacterized protein [Euwallacea similis]|uniref:uncharacterized protein n=1 Tax=Euwallacea similis TaxID=1736056 RepID=UPI00344F7DDC